MARLSNRGASHERVAALQRRVWALALVLHMLLQPCLWSCEEAVLTRDMRLHGCFLCNAAHVPCSGCAGASAVSRRSLGERVVTRDSSCTACASLRLIERLKRCENDVHSGVMPEY